MELKLINKYSMPICCAVFFRCVFVDAGVAPIDIETRKMKEQMKLKEAQARAIAEHGDLALITVDGPQSLAQERMSLRPPMLQVNKSLVSLHPPQPPHPLFLLGKMVN